MANKQVDIVIRFKDEEFWLDVLRKKFQSLSGVDIFLYGVDNNSTDDSLQVFHRFNNPNLKSLEVTNIGLFRPGASLNLGAALGSSPYIVFLSAHCIPKYDHYLDQLLSAIQSEPLDCAGVFARQLPLPCSGPQNTVDLALTYPKEDRIYRRTPMFNNANSIVRRSVYESFPFHPDVTNLEDLIWAKQVHANGFYTKYSSVPEVYHYHGIHQHKLHSGCKRIAQSIDVLTSYDWLQIDIPIFCLLNYYSFRVLMDSTFYSIKWSLGLDLVSRRPLSPGEGVEDFDYTVLVNGTSNLDYVAECISLAIEQNSQFSQFSGQLVHHNLQQSLSSSQLSSLIQSPGSSIFVLSKQLARNLDTIQ